MASTSPFGVRKPVSPCTTTSGRPPTALARTGTAHAIASSAARPNDSVSEGSRKRSLPRRISATSSTLPRKRTSRRSSRRSTSCSAASRSGPSPTSTSVAGSWRRTPAKTRTTSVTRLTGRKFETWTRTLWPGGAVARRVEHLLGEPRRRGMRDGVVHMHEVEVLAHRHFVLLHRQRQRVRRRLLEQGIFGLRDLVERHPLRVAAQPKRARVGDEVHLVPPPGELEPQLGRDGTGAAVGGVARNPDAH